MCDDWTSKKYVEKNHFYNLMFLYSRYISQNEISCSKIVINFFKKIKYNLEHFCFEQQDGIETKNIQRTKK